MSIHTRLRQLIAKENISVSQFEREIGVGKNTIATLLRKESSVSHFILEKISERFGLFASYWLLIGRSDDQTMLDCLESIKQEIDKIFKDYRDKLGKLE
mgnify:CR=1 FL=1